jgi:uncharacterized protein (TIGR02421 family)
VVSARIKTISHRFIESVTNALADNKQVRRSLPIWGRVHIDRQLPFLCVYRQRSRDVNTFSERLIMGEASYMIATGNRLQQKQLSGLVKNIASTLKKNFGAFLILEIWISNELEADADLSPLKPLFKIHISKKSSITSTIEALEKSLIKIRIRKNRPLISVAQNSRISPPGLSQLISKADLLDLGIHLIGIELRPVYRNVSTEQDFPLVRREFQHQFSRALKNTFFEFTNNHTPYRPKHFLSLGRWSMVKAVWEVDRQLAEICSGFDFLIQVTPTNSQDAWRVFKRNNFEKTPVFNYRPLPIDPAAVKRKLYDVPIERIEDPTLAQLFREQQMELDRKFTMLIDRNTKRFIYGSLQLYGSLDGSLVTLSGNILDKISPRSRDQNSGKSVNASIFAKYAEQELAYFKEVYPKITTNVQVRNDITGLMVSEGNLLIGSELKIAQNRIQALIQHEVGTHVLTYINGRAQPFRQLYIGLAGYEELQEGLAVLSEYLVGGLTRPRLRLLAARVIAVHLMISGASFVEVFRDLNQIYGYDLRTAFNITVRTFRSGGLTKDSVYLRGLVQLLEYLKNNGSLDPLFVGKISVHHVAIIKELQLRKVLLTPPLKPRYLGFPNISEKLNGLKNGLTPMELIKRSKI